MSASDWTLLLLLAPILVPLVVVRFLVGFVFAPPMPAEVSPTPEPTPRRQPSLRKSEPIAVDAKEPTAEAVDAEPDDVAPSTPLVGFRAEHSELRGGLAGVAPYRFRGS